MPTKTKSPRKRVASKKASPKPPWKKPAPKATRHSKLTKGQKSKAKSAAKRAGRPYPNLVDNMRAASAPGRKKPKGRS